MKLGITGGRDFHDEKYVTHALDFLHRTEPYGITHLIHGDAPGADRLAGRWAVANGVQVVICPANWKLLGNAAGLVRNQRMVELGPDAVMAFPGGAGTADMTRRARKAGIPIMQVRNANPPVYTVKQPT
jgi:hypothetical protein